MSYENPRISLNDNMLTVIIKMSDGNPDAVTVLARMLKEGATIDPDDAFGGLGAILSLDTFGIYGPDIWRLYEDVAAHDLTDMLGLLRAVQLGYLTERGLKTAIERGVPADHWVPHYVEKVRERLPDFGKVS